MKFNEKLQILRKEKGYSQEKLADLLEVSRQSVSKWESGTTYPEMDKLLSLCKIFNVTLDDLTNDEVSKNDFTKEKKNNFSNLVYTIIEMFDKSIDMFKNMNGKEKRSCIGNLLFVIVILLIFKIPFNYVLDLINNIIINLGPVSYNIIHGLFSFLINVTYLVLFLVILIFFYKSRYLDKYEPSEVNIIEEEEKENIVENNTTNTKEHKSFILFDILGGIFNFCIKFCLFFIVITLIFLLIGFVFGFVSTLIVFLKGVSILGLVLIFLALVIGCLVFLVLNISWLFSKKNNYLILLIGFLLSLVLVGTGCAIFANEITRFSYIEGIPSDISISEEQYLYDMSNDLLITSDFANIKFKENNELTDKVNVKISYAKDFMNILVDSSDDLVNIKYSTTFETANFVNSVINNLKNNEVYSYNAFTDVIITVEANKDNLEILKNNYQEHLTAIENEEHEEEIDYYYSRIDELEEENEKLRENNEEYKEQISELKEQINDYHERVKDLLSD